MPLQFTVLASGSAANSSLLEADGASVLIDVGLGPRQLAKRLAEAGTSWACVRAALLTHTHSDHWNERTLAHLRRLRIPLYCHPDHHEALGTYGEAFAELRSEGLVLRYEVDEELEPIAGLRCRPFPVRHDSGMTCGFRFETRPDGFGQASALGYAADLGCWEAAQVRALADVDVLALEFNHDVAMERSSGRSPRLIARVLGDHGHLSNIQAASLVREVLRRSDPERLQDVVQLHLSRDCNRPQLARAAAQQVLADDGPHIRLHTAHQHRPLPRIAVGAPGAARRAAPRSRKPTRLATPAECRFVQAWLPIFE